MCLSGTHADQKITSKNKNKCKIVSFLPVVDI